MGIDAFRDKASELKGVAKEKIGEVIDDHELQAEGAVEKMRAQANLGVREMSERIVDHDEPTK